jgi:transposase
MKQYLESQRNWLQVETLPGYSPDLNPVEDLWSNIKGQELANRCVAGPKAACAAAWIECTNPCCRFLTCTTRVSFLIYRVTLLCEIQ